MTQLITWFEIAAFLASLAAWRAIRDSRHLRLFPLLLFLIVVVEAYETFFRNKAAISNALLYNIQVPLQYLIYLLIIYHALARPYNKKVILFEMILLAAFTLVTGCFFTPWNQFNVLAYCLGSVLLIIGIVIKFYEMLEQPVGFNFLKDPFFYMLFAFLLFNVATVPYFAMINWLYMVKRSRNILVLLANVMSILNYILYTTYSIAFIWMIRRKALSSSALP